MSSSQISHSDHGGPISFDGTEWATLEFIVDKEGLKIYCNSEGFACLAELFRTFAERDGMYDHTTLDPTSQLSPDSVAVLITRKENGVFPSGATVSELRSEDAHDG